MTNRSRLLVAFLAANALAGLGLALTGADDPPRDGEAEAASVPFEMLPSNHMVVRTKINGKGPYQLIFDLGAPITLLSNRAAEDSGVVDAKTPKSFLFSMRGEADVRKLEVGDLTVSDLPVIVLDHPTVKVLGETLGRKIEGIIGYTFFARYRTTIDYQARRMTFRPVDFEVRNLIKDLPDRLVGPKVATRKVLSPAGLWGFSVGAPEGGPSSPGVPIVSIVAGSPAESAGLKPGDILASLDGRWTASVADTYAAAAATPPGKAVPVVVLRDGQEMTLNVTPAPGI